MKQTKVQKLGFKDYDDYLTSDRWVERRAAFAKNHPERCFVCETTSDCCLHHLSYDNVGNEIDSDMIWLCRKHHEQIHCVQNGKATIPIPQKSTHVSMRSAWLLGREHVVIKSFKALKQQSNVITNKQVKRLQSLGATDAEIGLLTKATAGNAINEFVKKYQLAKKANKLDAPTKQQKSKQQKLKKKAQQRIRGTSYSACIKRSKPKWMIEADHRRELKLKNELVDK